MISISVSKSPSVSAENVIAVGVFDNYAHGAEGFRLDVPVQKALLEAKQNGFKGEKSQIKLISNKLQGGNRFLFIGLGSKKDFCLSRYRRRSAEIAQFADHHNESNLFILFPTVSDESEMAQAITEGILLGSYKFDTFKSIKSRPTYLKRVVLLATDSSQYKSYQSGINRGTLISESTNFVRDLANSPPSDMDPDRMLKIARTLSKGNIRLKVFNKSQIAKMGMGGILGVNRGSAKPPYFLHLVYKPKNKRVTRRIGICGKGITFDSGGLSLKPAKSMETMKMDMTGAATVLGIFKALHKLQPKVEVHGIMPLTENMPGGRATKPGDVLKTITGKTIEVLNTDAEGRLILADALGYADKLNLDEILDIATLTGACSIALGPSIVGLMGTDPPLLEKIKSSSKAVGEKLWELPLEKTYRPMINSHVADVKNIGTPGQAGTIIAGIFLQEFIKPTTKWAHLDIASTAWSDARSSISPVPGATGVMVRTLLHYLLSH